MNAQNPSTQFLVMSWACHCCVVNSSSFPSFSLSLPHSRHCFCCRRRCSSSKNIAQYFLPHLDTKKITPASEKEKNWNESRRECYEHGAGCCYCALYINVRERVPFFRMRAPFPLFSRLIFCPWDFDSCQMCYICFYWYFSAPFMSSLCFVIMF